MTKTWKIQLPLLLASLLVAAACQEKIAPELSQPASTTTPPPPPTDSGAARSFSVRMGPTPTNASPTDLGYVLHKANFNSGVACSVTDVVNTPESLDTTRDIACFLEAEEQAVFFNGFELQAVATANTCEYIVQKPFFYWNFPPGLSLRADGSPRRMVYFRCDDDATRTFSAAAVPLGWGTYNAPAYPDLASVCNRYLNLNDDGQPTVEYGAINLDIAPFSKGVSVTEERDLCTYRYKLGNNEVNCDAGSIQITEVTMTSVDLDGDGVLDVVRPGPGQSRTVSCGGNIRNCYGGPARDIIGAQFVSSGFTGQISQIPVAGGSTKMTVQPSFPRFTTNLYSANFMRQCSGVANYESEASFTPGPGVSFNPDVMTNYSMVGVNTPLGQQRDSNDFDVIPLADHAFRGGIPMDIVATLPSTDPLRDYSVEFLATQPFYTFECLDYAYDIKARIRVAVREWNRIFSSSGQDFSFVSDVYNRALPFESRGRMDSGSPVTLLQYRNHLDNDPSNDVVDRSFNNRVDWDDFLKFSNSPSGLCGPSINVVPEAALPPLPVPTADDLAAQAPKTRRWFPRAIAP